jgi:hypothetical protein
MCFTGVILNPHRAPIVLWERLAKRIDSNPDGFYLRTPHAHVRTLDPLAFNLIFLDVLSGRPPYVHFHMRRASSGLKVIENVHGWRVGKYYITHNGIVSAYTSQRYFSDTFSLVSEREFQALLSDKDWKGLYEFVRSRGFWGVMFIVSHDFKEIYAISVDKPLRITRVKGVLYATSEKITRRADLYLNGVFKITYNRVEALHKELSLPEPQTLDAEALLTRIYPFFE